MELINPANIKKVADARKVIADLQARLLTREQALDDLVRAVEIAEITHQFQLVTSFCQTGVDLLQDRITIPPQGEDTEMKIRIYK